MNFETIGMEESSDAHMETDVSSTTEDLPDTQEVTGSNGAVEMVIVVEKVREEDMNEKIVKPLDKDNSVAIIPDEPPQASTALENRTKTPSVDVEIQLTLSPNTTKPESPRKVLNSDSPLKTVSPIPNTNENDIVDSSSKTEEIKSQNVDSEVTTNENPVVSTNSEKSEVQSPIKDPLPQENSITINEINKPIQTNTNKSPEHKNKEEPNIPNIIQVDITMEPSNDSQLETVSDTSEKEHCKSISRELKSLINSAKESKIISECTQLTSKTRKSRTVLDSSNTILNTSVDADKLHGVRRNSNNSQKSNCSEKSDKLPMKRSMRSQNPEFVSKVKQFLNSVTGKNQKDDDMTDDEIEDKVHNKSDESITHSSTPKKRKVEEIVMNKATKLRSDSYCWRCHWAVEQASNEKTHQPMLCTVCPRSFHYKCLSGVERSKINLDKNWVCPDCLIILQAESSETRSPAMKKISLGMLCDLLHHALERMMDLNGVEPFLTPVDRVAFADYDKYVVHPMDLSLMKSNIADGHYGSTEAFLADAQWILHNSIIFNTLQSKLTGGARALVRSCRAEMGEIEACPECYAAAHARRPTWFTDVCSTPHVLLWAKLKGFPYWPAKGMSVSATGLVDVRFFGAHDRAWVPAKDCFLYSEKDPNNFRTKRLDILDSMQEAEQHIRNISRKYGKFVYPPFKTQFEPMKLNEQLKMMIPTFEGEIRIPVKPDKSNGSPIVAKEKSRSNSKSSKSSCNDGDISELEDPLSIPQVKTPSTDMVEEDFTSDKAKIIEIEVPKTKDPKETDTTKKRRRSQLEEAIITILDNYAIEKRKRTDDLNNANNGPQPSSSKATSDKDKESNKAKDNKEEKKNLLKDKESNSATEKDNTVTIDISDKPIVVAPLKISFATSRNGRQTARVTNVVQSPKPTTSNDRSLLVTRISTPKEDKTTPQRIKPKTDKLFIDKRKEERPKPERRRNSKTRQSSGNNTPKFDKQELEKKNETTPNNTEKQKEQGVATKNINNKMTEATYNKGTPTVNNSKTGKDRVNYDDDTSLAVLAQDNNRNNIINNNTSGLPTISSVRSLSTVAPATSTTTTSTSNATQMIEVTVDGTPNANIFKRTSTDSIRTMKEATSKLQKLRGDTEVQSSMVGRVGVRAFARMTSPEKSKSDDMDVEIKTEPIDLDDADRHMEKMDLMNAFKLRPVNPPSKLREVVITPLNRRTATKVQEIRPRAKKTFPHPKKPEDGQLNGKNSMVYIPIQPPVTQAPRMNRPIQSNLVNTAARPVVSIHASPANIVNTVTSPLVPVITSMTSAVVNTTSQACQSIPTIGQVPTTVHTVPLVTSVNGQWMFSLQPVMSVGGVDAQPSPPIVNGLGERGVMQAVVSPGLPAAAAAVAPTLAAIAPAPQPPPPPPALAPAPAPAAPAPATPTPPPAAAPAINKKHTAEVSPPGEPPRLQQRPTLPNPLDSGTPLGAVPAPSAAGPLTAKLNQNAARLTDFFRTLLEESLEKLDDPATQVATLRLQLEQATWKHQQQIDEMKHNHLLTLAEVRAAFEKEKNRAVNEARRIAQSDLETAVKQTKAKQWCANCSQEAQFYCCWNTSYCDYPCQRAHWSQHFPVCSQNSSQDIRKQNEDGSSTSENRIQPQPENLPKSTSVPALTVGGKLGGARPFNQEQNNGQKTSIIMSMVEDNSGNQTMKCVGTYTPQKPPPPATAAGTQVSPLIINKQLMTAEEANTNRKVVTSGGYLILGGSVNTRVSAGGSAAVSAGVNTSVNQPASRRMHTIQYYT